MSGAFHSVLPSPLAFCAIWCSHNLWSLVCRVTHKPSVPIVREMPHKTTLPRSPYQWVCSAIPKARMNFVAWVTSMQCYLRRVRILRSTVRWEPSCLMHNTSRFLESAAAAFKSVLFSRRAWQRVVMVSCQQRVVTITCPASGNGLQDTRRLHSRGCHNSVCITLVGGRVMHCRM